MIKRIKVSDKRIIVRNNFSLFLLLISCCFLFSCTATSFLKDDETFYDGSSIHFESHGKVRGKKNISSKLEELIEPKPNFKFLGMRPEVWIYYTMDAPKKPKGLRSWIRKKVGEPPVLMKDVNPERTANILQGNLFNSGFFESQVSSSSSVKKKKGHVTYTIDLYPPFRIQTIEYPADTMFTSLIEEIKKESLIKTGRRYNLQRLKSELSRIEAIVENHGYYYFDDRYLLFEADTTVGNRKVDLTLTLLPETPEKAKRKYVLKDINIINDYYLHSDSTRDEAKVVEVGGYHYSSTNETYRPKIIANVVNLKKDSLYRRDNHNYTISHLMGLGTFKFVNIKYKESPDSLDGLNTDIFLTPALKKSLRFETQMVSKSNNFVGPGVGITFTNRNFMRGAERFEWTINGSYEWQISNKQTTPINAIQFSTEASLSIPRMILPVNIYRYSNKYLPRTNIKAGMDFQRRIGYFQMNSFNVGFGYIWRETTTKSHEFFPIDISYVRVSDVTADFQELLDDNPTLKNSFQNQFIPGMHYSFTLNTQLKEQETQTFSDAGISKSTFYFKGNFSMSGNLLHLINKNTSSEEGPPYSFLGQPYSQFVMGDIDFRYNWQMSRRNKLVTRIAFGSGYPYGNSITLPYVKQFSSGGSSSIRAFPARSIGPGTYNVYDDPNYDEDYFVDQRADIKLEGNVEFRYDIFRYLKGALFVDAGNIWLWSKSEDPRPGATFNEDTFLKELAVGTGLGFRLDFNFFIIRFDFAFPIRKPYLPDGERWVFDEIDFGSKNWRKENLILNIAIGYPF